MTGKTFTLPFLQEITSSNRSKTIILVVITVFPVLLVFSHSFSILAGRSVMQATIAAAKLASWFSEFSLNGIHRAESLIITNQYSDTGSFFSYKFILWSLVVSLLSMKKSEKATLISTFLLIVVIFILSVFRLILASLHAWPEGQLTSGFFSLPYRIILFLLPLWFYRERINMTGLNNAFFSLRGWRDNIMIVFIVAAIAGSLPGMLYGTGFFMFEWVIKVVFSMAKALLDIFSIASSINGRYLTNDHTSIFMSDSCAGLKVIVMFATLILAGRGKGSMKLVAIFSGTAFLLLLNAIRVMILFEINNERMAATVFDWWHSNFKYLFYLAVVIMWLLWLRFIEIRKPGMRTNESRGEEHTAQIS